MTRRRAARSLQPGRGPRHLRPRRPPAARRLRARRRRLHLRAGLDGLHRGRPRHLPPPRTPASCSSCRVWPATSSSPPCSSWARPSASRASTTSPSGCSSATGWQIVCVPGLIPEEAFFALLAARKFPVTDWIRKPEEFDYVVEPDVFHDLFGHVPLLFDPIFADYMQAYGAGGLKASRLDACELLARLYWYTVEFGLIDTPAGPARLRRRHPELGRRVALQRHQPRAAARGLRPAAPDAQPLPHRHLPGHLLRHRLVPAALRRDRARLHAGLRPRARDDCAPQARSRPAWCCRASGSSRSDRARPDGPALPATAPGGRPCRTCATPGRCRLSAPGSVAVAGGKTMLSQWL